MTYRSILTEEAKAELDLNYRMQVKRNGRWWKALRFSTPRYGDINGVGVKHFPV